MPEPFLEGVKTTAEILQSGGGYAIAALTLWALWRVVQWYRDETKAHLSTQGEMGTILQANSVALTERNASEALRNEAFKKSVESQQLAVVEDRAQTAQLVLLTQAVTELAREQARTREALIARGALKP